MIFTIAVQLTGGLALLPGVFTSAGAALLLAFTVAMTLLAHWPVGLAGEEFRRQVTLRLEQLAIVGGLLVRIAAGRRTLSVDAARQAQRVPAVRGRTRAS